MTLADQIEQTGRALTVTDLAGMLSLSEDTVYRYARKGKIPAFRIGTTVRFDPASVARWLREK